VRIVKPTAWSVEREPAALVSSLLHRMSPNLAHLGDGSRPSWRPLIGVVLPALSRLGHKGRPVPRMAVGGNYPNRILAQSPARATRSGHDHGFVQAGGQADFLTRGRFERAHVLVIGTIGVPRFAAAMPEGVSAEGPMTCSDLTASRDQG
jgi:hypothetical protein